MGSNKWVPAQIWVINGFGSGCDAGNCDINSPSPSPHSLGWTVAKFFASCLSSWPLNYIEFTPFSLRVGRNPLVWSIFVVAVEWFSRHLILIETWVINPSIFTDTDTCFIFTFLHPELMLLHPINAQLNLFLFYLKIISLLFFI